VVLTASWGDPQKSPGSPPGCASIRSKDIAGVTGLLVTPAKLIVGIRGEKSPSGGVGLRPDSFLFVSYFGSLRPMQK
jgi:hypothetical protein